MKEGDALQRVYAANTPAELAEAYAIWATDYDRDTIAAGYCLPFVITSWVARHIPRSHGPLLDAGCGTGLSGPYLAALGYGDVEGLDMSSDMLALAEHRGCYRQLTLGELGRRLDWPDGHFAGFVAAGVFTAGHAPAASLHELVRITRSGGFGIFTVRENLLEDSGFRKVFAELQAMRRWRPVEESAPFRAFVLDEADVVVRAFAFEIG